MVNRVVVFMRERERERERESNKALSFKIKKIYIKKYSTRIKLIY